MECVRYLVSLTIVNLDAVNLRGETADMQTELTDKCAKQSIETVIVRHTLLTVLCNLSVFRLGLLVCRRQPVARAFPCGLALVLRLVFVRRCGRSERSGAGGRNCVRPGRVRSPVTGSVTWVGMARMVTTGPPRRQKATRFDKAAPLASPLKESVIGSNLKHMCARCAACPEGVHRIRSLYNTCRARRGGGIWHHVAVTVAGWAP